MYNFISKMYTVPICQNVPKTTFSRIKPYKRQISTFYLNSFCDKLILPIWIKFVSNKLVYFKFFFFFIFSPCKMPPRMIFFYIFFVRRQILFTCFFSILGILDLANRKNSAHPNVFSIFYFYNFKQILHSLYRPLEVILKRKTCKLEFIKTKINKSHKLALQNFKIM